MDTSMADLRHAARSLRRTPGTTLVAILTLAVGLGANIALFGVVEPLLLSPLPLPAPDRLVMAWQTLPTVPARPVAPANFLDWRAQSRSFAGLAAFRAQEKTLGGGAPQRLKVALVSGNFFEVLGRRLARGAGFAATEPSGPREAVVSHGFWMSSLGGDPAAVGRTLTLDTEPIVVAGVLEPGFALPAETEVWVRAPRDVPDLGGMPGDHTQVRDARYLSVIGRLRDGVPLAAARAEMDVVGNRLRAAYPDANVDTGVRLVPLQEQVVGDTRLLLLLLAGVVAFVLLVACVNLANLMLARAVRREREMAVRVALGAGRLRLLRQMLTESLLLGVLGAAAGLMAALGLRPVLAALLPPGLPTLVDHASVVPLVAFSGGAAIVAALLFGLVPALQASAGDLAQRLRAGSRGAGTDPRRDRLRAALVTLQVALAVVLVAGAGLLARSVWRLQETPVGFTSHGVLSVQVSVPAARDRAAAEARALHARVIERVQALPGVVAAGAIQSLPLSGGEWSANLRVEGRHYTTRDAPGTEWRVVSAGYFDTLRIPLLQGRGFTAGDGAGAPPVALVNAALARLVFPGADPLGHRIGTGLDGQDAYATVIGVVGDTPQDAPRLAARPEMYRPLAQETRFSGASMSLVVRTSGAPQDAAASVRAAVRAVDPSLPVTRVQLLEDVALGSIARERLVGACLAVFGALALALAALGLYGVLACLVSERTREFAVRIALGATPRQVVQLVVSRGLALVALGATLGVAGAVALSGVLGSLLFEVAPTDPATHGAVVATLLLVGTLAAWLPARRATRADPILALRED